MTDKLEDIYVQFRLMVRSNTKNPRFYYSITYTTFGYTKIGGGTESGQTIKVTGKELKPNSKRNEKGWLAFDTEEFLLFDKARDKGAIKILGTLSDRTSRAFITIYQQTNKGVIKIVDFMSINWIYRHENIVMRAYWDVTKGLNSENPDTVKKQAISTHVCPHKYDGAIKVAEYIVGEIKRNVKDAISKQIRVSMIDYRRKTTKPAWFDAFDETTTMQNQYDALILWGLQVGPKMRWDHKPKIAKNPELVAVAVPRINPKTGNCLRVNYHKYKNFDYFYDVWSNIHYGYVGLSVGFNEEELLVGSNSQQATNPTTVGADTQDDVTTIKIGFALFKKFGQNADKLTAQDVLNILDKTPQSQFPESKKVHLCYDPKAIPCRG